MDLSTPALLFPAISLLLLAYTNRFMGLAGVIRGLHRQINETNKELIARQIISLRLRIRLIIWMQILGVLSITSCVIAMFLLFMDLLPLGQASFILSLVLMMLSLAVSLYELKISGHALNIELEDLER
ncbi:MAG: II family cellulose-binding protein [Cycloclasticus sp. symbiont of Bathymodiolus heckerae]|nr:MAG: II family cellulose-binding protein [Cycloclasticus sp. symbiont of Bathymodiolus heckerae]